MTELNTYWAIVINAIFTGIGVAVGTYIANKHIIRKAGKVKKQIKSVWGWWYGK